VTKKGRRGGRKKQWKKKSCRLGRKKPGGPSYGGILIDYKGGARELAGESKEGLLLQGKKKRRRRMKRR